jgi:mono/diheme cytochrome c family protein
MSFRSHRILEGRRLVRIKVTEPHRPLILWGSLPGVMCLIGALSLMTWGAVGCQDKDAPGGSPAAQPETPKLIYAQHCLGCHGATGEGAMGSNIQSLNRSLDQIVAVIANGQGKMPSFRGDLSDAKMRSVAGYVKTFKFTK